ncbi:hypothetical protein EDB89DRAFT_1948206 [Lactarius sanguifluus]|nr:hypothetical protein EDB89DRAFT_1948206 [Lactarius sanguifluus]
MATFQIHLLILDNSGEGDGFMSAEFQHTFGGRGMADINADVALKRDHTSCQHSGWLVTFAFPQLPWWQPTAASYAVLAP